MPTITDSKDSHQPGPCWCGEKHSVSDSMICRARDLMRDNPALTTEAVAHTLFEEFSELAKQCRVSNEILHEMTMAHACQMAEVRELVKKFKAEKKGKETGKETA